MTNYDAAAKEIEAAVRQGDFAETGRGVIEFRSGRFYLDGKRISVGEARALFLEIAEAEGLEAFLDDQES